MVHFLDWWLTWKDPAHCEWCLHWVGGPGCCTKAGWASHRSKPVSGTLQWPWHRLLSPDSNPVWVLPWFPSGMNYVWNSLNPVLTKLLRVMNFITALEIRMRCRGYRRTYHTSLRRARKQGGLHCVYNMLFSPGNKKFNYSLTFVKFWSNSHED